MASFATPAQLAVRLNRTFDAGKTAQVQALLDDATGALVDDVLGGNKVATGTADVTFNVPEGSRTITLPQQPVRSVASVLVDGVAITGWVVRGGRLILPRPVRFRELYDVVRPVLIDSVDVRVTWDYGVATVPAELQSWCLVLAAQALAQLEGPTGSLAPGAVQQVRIDDFSTSYATGGDESAAAPGLLIPERIRERLGARWGVGAFVTEAAP
jgi:hypothetical protein